LVLLLKDVTSKELYYSVDFVRMPPEPHLRGWDEWTTQCGKPFFASIYVSLLVSIGLNWVMGPNDRHSYKV
jgi:hypothetical protein